MTVGTVTGKVPAYQGSGLETGTNSSGVESVNDSTKIVIEQRDPVPVENKGPQKSEGPSREMPETNEAVKRAVEQMNRKARNSEAVFGIHEGTNRVTIKIVNKETKEVIREFPPEKTLDMIAKMWDLAGLMVNEKG